MYAAIPTGLCFAPSFLAKVSAMQAISPRERRIDPRMSALAALLVATLLGGCSPLPPRTPPGSKPSTSSPDTGMVTDPCEDAANKAARKRCRDMYEQARKGGD